jgi:Ni/Co efflux regulator RcnB
MKRYALAALAVAFTAPLAISTEAAAHERRGDNHRNHRGDDRWDRNNDWDNRDDRRDERRAYREGRRDGRHDRDRWDDRRYNGYHYNGRWYYGPPPAHWRDHARYDYRAWRRGDRLPAYYRDHYRPVDYRYYRLRPPPRGYHYVRDDRGELLLVGIATGVILGIIASQ